MKTKKDFRLTDGQPAISCFALSQQELVRRQTLAHARAEGLARQEPDEPAEDAGRRCLWHTDFPSGLMLLVCDNQLYRLTADLPHELQAANGGQALDFFDYGYVADVLREHLTALNLTSGDAQNLRRALAWVERRGNGLRDYTSEA